MENVFKKQKNNTKENEDSNQTLASCLLQSSSISVQHMDVQSEDVFSADLCCLGYLLSVKKNGENVSFSIGYLSFFLSPSFSALSLLSVDRKVESSMFDVLFCKYPVNISWAVLQYFEAIQLVKSRYNFFRHCQKYGGKTDKEDLHKSTSVCIERGDWLKIFVVWKISIAHDGTSKSNVFLVQGNDKKTIRGLSFVFDFLSERYSTIFAIDMIMRNKH